MSDALLAHSKSVSPYNEVSVLPWPWCGQQSLVIQSSLWFPCHTIMTTHPYSIGSSPNHPGTKAKMLVVAVATAAWFPLLEGLSPPKSCVRQVTRSSLQLHPLVAERQASLAHSVRVLATHFTWLLAQGRAMYMMHAQRTTNTIAMTQAHSKQPLSHPPQPTALPPHRPIL